MASGLSKKVLEIEAAIALLGHFHDRLRYLSPTMTGLIESACAAEGTGNIPYLTGCRERMGRGLPFPDSWKAAVAAHPGALGREETGLLAALGDVLGATDLESQLAAVAYTRQQLELRLDIARQYRDRHHKLYGTLGVLTGIAIVIILI